MSHAMTTSVARQIGSLFGGGSVTGLSDRQLIERFVARRDAGGEAAFSALVARHGPMVLSVCRQLLGDHQQAEDAFQAVFLVLARRARFVHDPDLLGNWLYGVALRTARKARAGLARRRESEAYRAATQPETCSPVPADQPAIEREQAEALHAEIDRLPASSRVPVVLCYFEGLSLAEAAQRLRCPAGTVHSRLVRARERLRRGLVRRGIALSGTALAAALAPKSASASISPILCDATTRAALQFAARHAAGVGLSASAAALAREVLRTMLLHTLPAPALLLLLLSSLITGAGYLTRTFAVDDGPRSLPAAPQSLAPPKPAAVSQGPTLGRMTVVGRALDRGGKPVPHARVAVLADRHRQVGDRDGRHRNILMGTAAVGADGRFALEFPAMPGQRLEHLSLVAAARGRAFTVVDLKIDTTRQETSVALEPEKPAVGRLVDVQGQPAAGVVVRVAALNFKHQLAPYDAQGEPSLWPSPVTTGPDGRFRVVGLGADASPTYEVEDPRYARQRFSLHAQGAGEGNEVHRPNSTVTLRPAQAFDVHVVHFDDGTPASGALVTVQSIENSWLTDNVAQARTDGQGRARVVAWPAGGYRVVVHAPAGEPYLHAWRDIDWPIAAVQKSVELKLWRGVIVRGRLIEEPAGTPVAGAWAVYYRHYATTHDRPTCCRPRP